ncbi:hypothetical protein NQL31_005842 [Lotmaria passim]
MSAPPPPLPRPLRLMGLNDELRVPQLFWWRREGGRADDPLICRGKYGDWHKAASVVAAAATTGTVDDDGVEVCPAHS